MKVHFKIPRISTGIKLGVVAPSELIPPAPFSWEEKGGSWIEVLKGVLSIKKKNSRRNKKLFPPSLFKRRGRGMSSGCVKIFAILVLFTAPTFPDEAASLFQQGNQAYQAGNYEQAAAAYERIVALKKENWQVYYNLGNAYFKQRKNGLAILNYERALRLNRANEDIRFNLNLANLAIMDRILEPPRSAAPVWLDDALNFFPHEQAAGYALLFWWGTLLGVSLLFVGRKESWRKLGRMFAWSFGALCLLFACVFFLQWYEQSTEQYGVVLDSRVVAHSSPAADATEVFIIHEGAKVRLQEHTGAWQRIRLADGKVGWLKAEGLAKI